LNKEDPCITHRCIDRPVSSSRDPGLSWVVFRHSPHATDACSTPKYAGCIALSTINMIQGTRRWLRRNRTNFAIGAGVLGAGYLAGQYVLGKLGEARQRMSDDRIAKEKCAPYFLIKEHVLTALQSPPPLRTEPGRLHLHRPRHPTDRDREHTRCHPRGASAGRATEAKGRAPVT
jgi:hypothetical protein